MVARVVRTTGAHTPAGPRCRTRPITSVDGSTRAFLNDTDEWRR